MDAIASLSKEEDQTRGAAQEEEARLYPNGKPSAPAASAPAAEASTAGKEGEEEKVRRVVGDVSIMYTGLTAA